MFGKPFVRELISRSAEDDKDRRTFLKAAGVTGLGAVAATAGVGSLMSLASASSTPAGAIAAGAPLDEDYNTPGRRATRRSSTSR